jgi:hypothetical protein
MAKDKWHWIEHDRGLRVELFAGDILNFKLVLHSPSNSTFTTVRIVRDTAWGTAAVKAAHFSSQRMRKRSVKGMSVDTLPSYKPRLGDTHAFVEIER